MPPALRGDQEHVALAGLERGDAFGARLRRRAAVQVLVGDAGLVQVFLHEFEVHDELREHEHFVAVLQQFVERGGEGFEFRALGHANRLIEYQARIAAREAQARQVAEEREAALAFAHIGIIRCRHCRDGPLPERLVERGLVGRQRDVQGDLGAFRQVVEDLGLEPAQNERRDDAAQP